MIEELTKELEKLSYDYREQKKVYYRYSHLLLNEDKYSLIYKHLNNKMDFWSRFRLLCDIALEISDYSNNFIFLLSEFEKKVRKDMGQKPFLDLLRNLGSSKDFALNLYEKILKNKDLEDELKIVSGLILGEYCLNKSDVELKKKLKEEIRTPLTNSYLNAILIVYENREIDPETKHFLDKVLENNNLKILNDLARVSLNFYNKEQDYFYNIIKEIVSLKDSTINESIFTRLSYDNMLTKEHFFALVDEVKDSDLIIIEEIVRSFKQYPGESKRIVDLLFHWIYKFGPFKFNSSDLGQIIEELIEKNKFFISDFFERYKVSERKEVLLRYFSAFETFFRQYQGFVLEQILKFKDEPIFFELCEMFIGSVYPDSNKKDLVKELNEELIRIAKKRNYISFKEEEYRKKLVEINRESKKYCDYLVNSSKDLLDQLMFRKETYDFELIRKSISKYKTLEAVSKDLIDTLEREKKFSRLLWLGESETPELETIDRNQLWKGAYLEELNLGLEKYLSVPNQEHKDLIKCSQNNLRYENRFWTFQTELLFINRFCKSSIVWSDPKVPNRPENNLDLQVKLFEKEIYFEIIRPELPRNLTLSNKALSTRNRVLYVIKEKLKQIMSQKTVEEMKKKERDCLFFIVIDTSGSIIDDILARASFEEQENGLNTEILSGVIYFKQDARIDENNKPFIKLLGDIIQNPKGINRLNEKELERLKKIVFG